MYSSPIFQVVNGWPLSKKETNFLRICLFLKKWIGNRGESTELCLSVKSMTAFKKDLGTFFKNFHKLLLGFFVIIWSVVLISCNCLRKKKSPCSLLKWGVKNGIKRKMIDQGDRSSRSRWYEQEPKLNEFLHV